MWPAQDCKRGGPGGPFVFLLQPWRPLLALLIMWIHSRINPLLCQLSLSWSRCWTGVSRSLQASTSRGSPDWHDVTDWLIDLMTYFFEKMSTDRVTEWLSDWLQCLQCDFTWLHCTEGFYCTVSCDIHNFTDKAGKRHYCRKRMNVTHENESLVKLKLCWWLREGRKRADGMMGQGQGWRPRSDQNHESESDYTPLFLGYGMAWPGSQTCTSHSETFTCTIMYSITLLHTCTTACSLPGNSFAKRFAESSLVQRSNIASKTWLQLPWVRLLLCSSFAWQSALRSTSCCIPSCLQGVPVLRTQLLFCSAALRLSPPLWSWLSRTQRSSTFQTSSLSFAVLWMFPLQFSLRWQGC